MQVTIDAERSTLVNETFAFRNNEVAIPELFGEVKIFDLKLKLLERIGVNERVRPEAGWPQRSDWGWPTLPGYPDLKGTPEDRPGFFISPHGAALGLNHELYVAEWIKTGRITRIDRTAH